MEVLFISNDALRGLALAAFGGTTNVSDTSKTIDAGSRKGNAISLRFFSNDPILLVVKLIVILAILLLAIPISSCPSSGFLGSRAA